jgi:hypothetical protein
MNIVMKAKSQDVVVLLKWLCCPAEKSYADLASELGMSVGEVHGATQRAAEAGLLDRENKRPRINALREYLVHGVKYAFPAHRGAPSRGMPTSYAAPPLREHFPQDDAKDLPPVWPDPEGKVRGYALEPLFRSVPYAARRDPQLYDLLALVDALREGRARERNLAAIELGRRLEALGNREVVPA